MAGRVSDARLHERPVAAGRGRWALPSVVAFTWIPLRSQSRLTRPGSPESLQPSLRVSAPNLTTQEGNPPRPDEPFHSNQVPRFWTAPRRTIIRPSP